MPRRFRAPVAIVIGAVVVLAAWVAAPAARAHPLDRLTQHLLVNLEAEEIRLTLAIGGGMLANEVVLADLDRDGDGRVTEREIAAWRQMVLERLTITIDGEPVFPDTSRVEVLVPDLHDFHVGLKPLMLSVPVRLEASGGPADHYLAVRNDYRVDRSDFQFAVGAGSGTDVLDAGWPSAITRVAFRVDPSLTGDSRSTVAAAETWGASGVIAKAEQAFSREKTPRFVLAMLGVFLALGALHALQPGHGKTLVAAYLVATGGTAKDALILAGIVTFTHTISVFAIGAVTLVASELFLPSRVMPVLEVLSGLLVAGMGALMLWRGEQRRRHSAASHAHHHDHDRGHDHHHHHDHDHDRLTEEEHARLHLAEVETVRRGVGFRGLAALGVSGGMVPCPDALAILLLAIGINQLAFGMVAIVAFSLGLAGVLIAFGLMIALVGPFWSRAKGSMVSQGGFGARFGAGVSRLAAASPMISALVVLVLGLAMIGRATGALAFAAG